MKTIKWIFISICCLPFILLISTSCFNSCTEKGCNPIDYARITDVEYKAVVVDEPRCKGKIVVTERLTFDIHAASKKNLFWELWRDLCESNIDGVKVSYKVNSVKQILDDGTEVIYEKSPKLYWDDYDYVKENPLYGPGKWYHSKGPYNEEEAQYECVLFYVDGIYREEVVFEIEYEMYNAALRYGDCSDLYISMFSDKDVYNLESFKAQILFPDEIMPSPGNYIYTTYGTNSNNFPVEESDTINPGYHTFIIDLDKDDLKFRPYNEYIEFDLVAFGEDKHIFTQYASKNHYYNDPALDEILFEQDKYANLPDDYKIPKAIVFVIFTILSGFVLFYCLTRKYKYYKKYLFYTPMVDYTYFRDIPSDLDPKFAAELALCKHKKNNKVKDGDIYAALMLSLVRKGYIEMQDIGKNDIQIIIKKCPHNEPRHAIPADAPINNISMQNTPRIYNTYDYSCQDSLYDALTTCEAHYFNLIVHHANGNHITMSTFRNRITQDYAHTDKFLKNIDNSVVNIGIEKNYIQKSNYKEIKKSLYGIAGFYKFTGYLFLILINYISYRTRMDFAYGAYTIFGLSCLFTSYYLKELGRKLILLTQFGESEYSKWYGLYNFLNSSTLIKERTHIELPIWEKYLVYATAFGISTKVSKAIEIRCPEYNSSAMLSNGYYRSDKIRISCRGVGSSIRTGSSIARGGGYGGGYGGGGRGGGGGGGGH